MLNRIPRVVPPLNTLLADLGNPSRKTLAKVLDVHWRTVQRWTSADKAPRAVMLALFWMTRWGRSALECEALNETNFRLAIARNAMEENQKLGERIDHLSSIADFGSANDPAQSVAAADPVRKTLKAFLASPPHGTSGSAQTSDLAAPPTSSAGTEEPQQPSRQRHR